MAHAAAWGVATGCAQRVQTTENHSVLRTPGRSAVHSWIAVVRSCGLVYTLLMLVAECLRCAGVGSRSCYPSW